MNSILMCFVFVVLAQGWERPDMEASELAAPASMQAQSGAQQETASEDLDSNPTPAQPAPPVATRWEYDEDGNPVARVVEEQAASAATKPVDTKPAATPKKEAPENKETKQQKNTSERIATFWFLLPRK